MLHYVALNDETMHCNSLESSNILCNTCFFNVRNKNMFKTIKLNDLFKCQTELLKEVGVPAFLIQCSHFIRGSA